jgi:hypothetical protein
MISVLKDCKNPEILVITPLLNGHKISKQTKTTIKRNSVPFVWLSSMDNKNIPTNIKNADDWYIKRHGKLPPYQIIIDNDITLGRNMLDRLLKTLKNSDENVAFSYASFKYTGYMNAEFIAVPYNINKLLQHNYISSNSLVRTDVIQKVGLVTDEKYKRLLDWAFYLKLFYHGYIGAPCVEASFIAMSDEKSVSSQSNHDYGIKRNRVLHDFGVPIVEKYGS